MWYPEVTHLETAQIILTSPECHHRISVGTLHITGTYACMYESVAVIASRIPLHVSGLTRSQQFLIKHLLERLFLDIEADIDSKMEWLQAMQVCSRQLVRNYTLISLGMYSLLQHIRFSEP